MNSTPFVSQQSACYRHKGAVALHVTTAVIPSGQFNHSKWWGAFLSRWPSTLPLFNTESRPDWIPSISGLSYSPPHTHNTYSTLPTHENKQSSLKPAGFTSAEGVMKLIFWELFCVWKTPGKRGLPFLSPCCDGGITESAISTRRDRKTRTLFHDWIFASWVIQYLVMDSASKNPFLIAFLEGCGHAGPMAVQSYTHMFLACLLTLRSEHYRSRQKGILKYLEAGV